MDMSVVSSAGWGVLLVLAVPFAIIVLNELLERVGNRRADLASILRLARDLVLPTLVLLLVLRVVFGIGTENALSNMASTVFWLLMVVLVYRVAAMVIGGGEYDPSDWRARSPRLFLLLVPYSLIGLIVYHVSQNLWALPVREMATTLGIGSVVIAFALQATLSNLVSGLLMIANSPFKTGDWVRVDDIEGQIVGVNWRYTEVVDWQGNLVVFPNGAIADGSIYNFSRPQEATLIPHSLQFSVNTPPNDIKRLLMSTMEKTPRILRDPEPAVFVSDIENPIVTYTVEFWIEDYGAKDGIKSDFLTRVWYAARRAEIPIPVPMQEFRALRGEGPRGAATATYCRDILVQLPGFGDLSEAGLDDLVSDATSLHFAENERILDIGDIEEGVYIVTDGEVRLNIVSSETGEVGLLDVVREGGVFGENGLFGRAVSPVNVIAQSDCELILVSHRSFIEVLGREHRLNDEVNALINQRNQTARRLTSAKSQLRPNPAPAAVKEVSSDVR